MKSSRDPTVGVVHLGNHSCCLADSFMDDCGATSSTNRSIRNRTAAVKCRLDVSTFWPGSRGDCRVREAEADAGVVVDVSAVHLEAVGEEANAVIVVVTGLDLELEECGVGEYGG